MIHLIKYKPEYTINESYEIELNIINDTMSVVIYDNTFGVQEFITLQTKILPYNRYIICLDKTRKKIRIINTTEYESFKDYRLWYFYKATGNIILYTIAVCDMNFVIEPGTILVKNIIINSNQPVKEYYIKNTEEQDYYFWKYLNSIRDIYTLTLNENIYYPSIVENNDDTPSIKNINSIIDIQNNKSKYTFTVQRCNNITKKHIPFNGNVNIHVTSGELNTNILTFKNGISSFIFYPLGYKGDCIISIGEIFDGSFYKIKL